MTTNLERELGANMSDTIPDGGAFDDAATRAAESMNTVT
ncbi:MAG: hypothetical protein JWP66_1634, partial [Naasia sp.]|nr:hypothetical protein [Naasia sp.]